MKAATFPTAFLFVAATLVTAFYSIPAVAASYILEIRYGVADQAFGPVRNSGSGTKRLSSKFLKKSELIEVATSSGQPGLIVQNGCKMQYVLIGEEGAAPLTLRSSLRIRTDQGIKALATTVALVPGQWLILGGEVSRATIEGTRHEERYYVLVRVTKAKARNQPGENINK